jgi:NADH-quinone oxidoreductase subunit G
MIEIEIDGKKVEVPPGSMVMDAANKLGTYIPHFCYHKKLSIAANCRMCLVEVEKAPKPLPACATPVSQGMIVRSHSDKAVQAQKSVMEFLLINHPLDCPICDQGGECQLQDLAVGYGPSASRYQEEKRVVFHKSAGPLISMEEMSRCIHCTRCVRFGQEIAGVMELGMLGRGEHSEITSFVGKTVDSEMSGNMIDLCPVGALTSKPFRYSARTWELSRRKSVSPHDGLGANLTVQVKNNKVLRVLPLENELVNECWISDKDRFSYEALNSDQRLTKPMLKQGGEWREVEWQQALEYIAHGLKNIKHEHGAESIAAIASPHSTLEELYLLQKAVRGIGSDNIETRLRQTDFALDGKLTPWLGMPIAEVSSLKQALIIGSFLRKDHPLLATRLRAAAKTGAKLHLLHAADDDHLMRIATKMIMAPSEWLSTLGGIAYVIAAEKGITLPAAITATEQDVNPYSMLIAKSMLAGEHKAVFLGNAAVQHPQAANLHIVAQWIAEQTESKLGYLTEAANTVGAYLAKAMPSEGKAQPVFAKAAKAYLVLHAEPEFDSHNPQAARAALDAAEMVVVMSPFKHGMDYADVLLPIAPFTETSGTFVNCEGRAQSFYGTVKPLADTRPAWKVLRVLGNLLGVAGFEYETSEAVRDEALGAEYAMLTGSQTVALKNHVDAVSINSPALKDNNHINNTTQFGGALQRLTDVPIYFADPIVRRAASLQKAFDAKAPKAWMSGNTLDAGNLKAGNKVTVTQGAGKVVLEAALDDGLADGVVRIAAAHPATMALGAMFGAVQVQKAGEGA